MSVHPDGPSVAVVGGGIAGLAAAFFLRDSGARVTVLDGAARLGGNLAVSEVAGIAVDEGAEALLARRPEGKSLIAEVGLAGAVVPVGTSAAGIWTRGRLYPLPRRQFMGVPADLDELAATGILSDVGLDRARQDLSLPDTAPSGDVSVQDRVGARFGQEVVDKLVDPLLGGVYAGRSDDLSFEATLAPLAQAGRGHRALSSAAASLLPSAPGPAAAVKPAPSPAATPAPPAAGTLASAAAAALASAAAAALASAAAGTLASAAAGTPASAAAAKPAPVFCTLTGGLGTLPAAVAAASGADVRTRAMVREIARTPRGWRLTVGSAHAPERVDADAVIVAVPARPASRLLADVAAPAAAALSEFSYASMAVITLAYPAGAFPEPPGGSGYLVPAVDGRAVKAVTFSSVKWPHLRQADPGIQVVRCSIGRLGEAAVLQREDSELVAMAAADLAAATGVTGRPLAARVSRWGGGLPQYSVGHLDRVARIRAGVAAQPGLAVCGAAYDGVGVPACIASARLAADQVLGYLRSAVWTAPAQGGE
jgi:oxygen-dependent protoporphyrinogen oxidase